MNSPLPIVEDSTAAAGSSVRAKNESARNIAICLAAVSAAILATWPLAEGGYADDFAYMHVALNLSRTGRFVYNGWEFAMLIAHAGWGALAIKCFGFSFQVLRFSTIPFALGSVVLCYLLVQRAGVRPVFALLATLTLGLSPLFVPLSTTYMTDIPCLFYTLASLFSISRAAESGKSVRRYAWLALGVVAGLVGGTGRQVVWLVPLVVLPLLAWFRRRETRFAAITLAAWAVASVAIARVTWWFNAQPYAAPQPSVLAEVKLTFRQPLTQNVLVARMALMLLLMVLPTAAPLLVRLLGETWRGTNARRIVVALLLACVLGAILIHPSLASIPWISSTLNWEGINGSAPMPGRPIVLIRPVRVIVALAVYVSVCLLAGEFVHTRRHLVRIWNAIRDPSDSQFVVVGMSAFGIIYFALLIVRGSEVDLFDRYLLPIMPCVATLLLLWYEVDASACKRIDRRPCAIAWGVLAVLGCYAVASAQDYWSLARARKTAVRMLEASGVSRVAIDAGFDYNGWTQLLVTGYLNDRYVKNPPQAYRPGFRATPDVVPLYRLEYQPTLGTVPTEFGSVPYFSLLPPFRKQVRIDRLLVPGKFPD